MHAAAAVLFGLFVVTADNQSATTLQVTGGRASQPTVVAAGVPTVAPIRQAPTTASNADSKPGSQSRIPAPTVVRAPQVATPTVAQPRQEIRVPAIVGDLGFSPATEYVAHYRVKDHTTSPKATSAALDAAAAAGLVEERKAAAPIDSDVTRLPAAPLTSASPVVVAAEPLKSGEIPPSNAKGTVTEGNESQLAEKLVTTPAIVSTSTNETAKSTPVKSESLFTELKNGVQDGLNKVLPASHSRSQGSPSGHAMDDNLSAPAQPSARRNSTIASTSRAKNVAVEPTHSFVRPAHTPATSRPEMKQQNNRQAHQVAAAPRTLPRATPAAATQRTVVRQDGLEPAPAMPRSLSNPAASAGPLTGPGPFDYMYAGQEAPPWMRPYDEDPNLRNFWYHTEPRLKHGKVPHCCSTCNLLPHVEYFPEGHANYYFRPYTFTRLLQQQDQAARMGINPALPYSNEIYDKVYAEFEARKRTETVDPGEMPGEMQEFETDTERSIPSDEG